MSDDELAAEYASRRERILVPLAQRLSEMLVETVSGIPRVDRVSVRAKDAERFMGKALKIKDGIRKYDRPLVQIQDQIGARIIVYYLSDVDAISSEIEKYFTHIEAKEINPDSEKEFGYVGTHYILAIPEDVYPEDAADVGGMPKFFELQVKTLFQHAWSEAEHDLSYKAPIPLTSQQKRQLAFTAAQAWGADEIFHTLAKQLIAEAANDPVAK
ncbi:RelA/SpoT domain-containing protein [Burkholderia cenocepacia]|uniref:GTP pyrophosphokinase n=1 Tax=Burkholderia cenocepacia TaxID=95486 RepID=UPI00047FE033|nr:RelA/SpoT domain-containing protein [Burkholderia cenocepacia]MBR7996113.1 RelA/SpoT domain-containing protein [Burkholderia cenocepacia]